MIRSYLFNDADELYRDHEGGKMLEVASLGDGRTIDGTVNFIVDVKSKKEYRYFK